MATRFRLTADTATPAVSPAFQSYSHNQSVRRILLTSDSSALTTSAYNPDGGAHEVAGDSCHIQFVSNPMNSGITFTLSDVIKMVIQGIESSANANLFVLLFISIVSEDGGTVRRTLRSKVADATEMATSLTSRLHSTTQDGSNYTTVAGDRLVVEIAVNGTPAGSGANNHNASLRWGSNGADGDLLENDTETGTTRNPWIEFVPTITFQATATRGRISWTELEVPFVPTRGRISFAEFELPFKPTRGRISWAEFELPLKPTKGLISWTEFEVPDIATPTRGQISWTELEIPLIQTRGRISWTEFEVPDVAPPSLIGPEDTNINIMVASSLNLFRKRLEHAS